MLFIRYSIFSSFETHNVTILTSDVFACICTVLLQGESSATSETGDFDRVHRSLVPLYILLYLNLE